MAPGYPVALARRRGRRICHGHRRYDSDVLGRLAFIGVAQDAGFKLSEIKQLVGGIDDGDALSEHIRSASTRKLDEVEALLERTRAMKGWLEVARECGCATPAECSLFPVPGDDAAADGFALSVVQITGRDCRRQP